MLLEISVNSQENICTRVSFIKKETLAQVFSCEVSEISKNTFFTEHLWATASGSSIWFDWNIFADKAKIEMYLCFDWSNNCSDFFRRELLQLNSF